jgi:hypothetical protein
LSRWGWITSDISGIGDMRINYQWGEEFMRILDDAATPPYDVNEIQERLDAFEYDPHPYEALEPVKGQPWLQELKLVAGSGHTYGLLLEEMADCFDAIAYYRSPPLMHDPRTRRPHGRSREHALVLAQERQHDRTI